MTKSIVQFQAKYIQFGFRHPVQESMRQVDFTIKKFDCGEFEFCLKEDVSGRQVFVFYGFTPGLFNEDIIRLQLILEVLYKNKAKTILFSPFLPYTRQDVVALQCSSGARVMAAIAKDFELDKIITYDMHNPNIARLFKKITNLSMIPYFIKHIKELYNTKEVVLCFPDSGAKLKFSRFAENEGLRTVYVEKRRNLSGITISTHGDIKNDDKVIIIDDMIDTAGTLLAVSSAIMHCGARFVSAYATHGIFSSGALKKIQASGVHNVTVSNSIINTHLRNKERLTILPIKSGFDDIAS